MGTAMDLKETELCLGLPGGGVDPFPTTNNNKYWSNGKRGFSETMDLKLNVDRQSSNETPADGGHVNLNDTPPTAASFAKDVMNNLQLPASAQKDPIKPPAKAQVVGWPPVRSYRKNIMATTTIPTPLQSQKSVATEEAGGGTGVAFVKVSIDGAPYLRKVDLKLYKSYQQLSDALGKMFSSFTMGKYGTQGGGTIDFMNESKLMDLLNSSEYVPTYEDKDGDWMLVGDVPWEMFVDSCKRLRIMKGSEAIGLAPRAMEKCKSRS